MFPSEASDLDVITVNTGNPVITYIDGVTGISCIAVNHGIDDITGIDSIHDNHAITVYNSNNCNTVISIL